MEACRVRQQWEAEENAKGLERSLATSQRPNPSTRSELASIQSLLADVEKHSHAGRHLLAERALDTSCFRHRRLTGLEVNREDLAKSTVLVFRLPLHGKGVTPRAGLLDLIRSHTFVGMADSSLALVQHGTRLHLADLTLATREMFYQQVGHNIDTVTAPPHSSWVLMHQSLGFAEPCTCCPSPVMREAEW